MLFLLKYIAELTAVALHISLCLSFICFVSAISFPLHQKQHVTPARVRVMWCFWKGLPARSARCVLRVHSSRLVLLCCVLLILLCICYVKQIWFSGAELTARVGAAAASAIRQHGGFLLIHLHFRRRTQRGVTWKGTLLFHFLLLTLLKKTHQAPALPGLVTCFALSNAPGLRSSLSRDWTVVTVVTMVPSGMMVRSTSTFLVGVREERSSRALWALLGSCVSWYNSWKRKKKKKKVYKLEVSSC